MIDPLVRDAVAADTGQLDAIAVEARERLVDQRGGRRWLETHPVPDWTSASAIVAHIDEVIVGYLVVSVARGVATVDEVYVTPMARELGFGDALLDAGRKRAREAGAHWLEGEALPGDRDTKNLYERAGITARLITVSTEL